MNIGIYIESLSDTNQLNYINDFIENNINNETVDDISLFYDDVSYNPFNTKCGMFNSTELWSFNGNLIVTSLNSFSTAKKVINNINLFYYYGWNEKEDNLQLAILLNSDNTNIICRSSSDYKEIYRITGKKPVGISENFNNIVELLSEHEDEYKSNNNDVYQTA